MTERDEILEAVVCDELRDLGLCEYEVDEVLGTMRDEGMFDVPDLEGPRARIRRHDPKMAG